MNHLYGIGGHLKEAQRKRDGHGCSLCGVLSDRKRAEYDGIYSSQSQTVPNHFISAVAAEFLLDNNHCGKQRERPEHFLTPDIVDPVERLNSYCQHHETDKE